MVSFMCVVSMCSYRFIVEVMMLTRLLDKPHESTTIQGALNEVLALRLILFPKVIANDHDIVATFS